MISSSVMLLLSTHPQNRDEFIPITKGLMCMLGARVNMNVNIRTIEDLVNFIECFTNNVVIRYEKRNSTRKAMNLQIALGIEKDNVEFGGIETVVETIDLPLFYELDKLVQALENKGIEVELVNLDEIRQQPKTTRQRPRFY